MPFPDVPREIYGINPIDEVICQLRFPAVLKIDVEVPAEFQERIRDLFAVYRQRPAGPLTANLPQDVAAFIARELPGHLGQASHATHQFCSEDGIWILGLARDSIYLTCKNYERWETFKEHLIPALGALRELYSPAFFSRVGLRYRDGIRRSVLGLNGVPWAELLRSWIAGPFASPDPATEIEASRTEVLLKLHDDGARLRVMHGLGIDESTKEECYILDADLFNDQRTELGDEIATLDFLNRQSRLFFRWCITDRLRQAMRPCAVK